MKTKKRFSGLFQFAQFGLIGLLNALVDIGSLNLFMYLWPTNDKQWLILFNTISYTLAITNSYIWNSRLTFRKHAKFSKREIFYFIIQAIVSLLISNGVFIAGVSLFSLLQISEWFVWNISKGFAMFLSSLASFFFMKYIVFHKKKIVNE